MTLDARKTPDEIYAEWCNCTKCALSNYREPGRGALTGGGTVGGIMFIATSPSQAEVRSGEIFSNEASMLLHRAIERLQVEPAYFTYLVGCHSCSVRLDDSGNPRMRTGFRGEAQGFMLEDQAPLVPYLSACRPRLLQEIYTCDPRIVVALGQQVASALLGSSVNMLFARGTVVEFKIPGATLLPERTKAGVWERKQKGVLVKPMAPFPVRYQMVVTHDVQHVFDRIRDEDKGNPFSQFAEDLKLARDLYRKYYTETTGIVPTDYTDPLLRDLRDELIHLQDGDEND